MSDPEIESLESPRKKIKRENLGGHGRRRRRRRNVHRRNAVNLATQPLVDLPSDVLSHIFAMLPIKEAVRASTLSRRLKESWLFNRMLCFDKNFAKHLAQNDFLEIVNRVFNLHMGTNIQTFSLFFDPTGVEDAVENWIQMAIDKEVEELDLDFSLAKVPYKITSDFADIVTIKTLKLCRCELELLPTFTGLNSLKTLVLRKIEIISKSIETVFLNCFSLETLELVKCRKIGHLRILAQRLRCFKALKVGDCLGLCELDIDSPTIRSFYYSGRFILFKLDEISQLNDVIINFKPLKGIGKFFRREGFLCDFSHVHLLSASSTLLEELSPNPYDNKHITLRFNFSKLKELQLFMDRTVYCNLYEIANFLRKCPCLEKLFIDFNGVTFEPQDYFWVYHQRPAIERDRKPLKCLKFVKLDGFKFEEHEIEILQFLLERAIVLETLVIVAPKTARQGSMHVWNVPFCRTVTQRCPVSPFVKVRFYDCDCDNSPAPVHPKTWFGL